ncbi:MAG: pyroglutamyl-peptidase I [Pseudomonadota bacterium]|nr:pyroglutamyl-peptidase I [Pseudomonadota bacterium]
MKTGPILVTGFEPYGGRGSNPAHAAMQAVDGLVIDGVEVVGRGLAVSIASLMPSLEALFAELRPAAMVGLGLCPGEPVIRIERIGINLADFEIADNEGRLLRDDLVVRRGAGARFTTLPVREIETALLAANIPARLSVTAGTYLCNACLYGLLEIAERYPPPIPCGFLHLPYSPEQVAEMLAQRHGLEQPDAGGRDDLASMELAKIIEATRLVLGVVASRLKSACN